jgi:hypothetical protein
MNLRFKYDYCKEKREQLTTTINCSLHDKYKELSESCGQPKSKILDVLLMELFDKNEAELNEFIQKVKLY